MRSLKDYELRLHFVNSMAYSINPPFSDNDSADGPAFYPNNDDTEARPPAQLSTINIARLQEQNAEEAAKLFRAAKEDGVFYTDLKDWGFVEMTDRVDDIFALSKALFDLDEREKMQYDVDKVGRLKLNG